MSTLDDIQFDQNQFDQFYKWILTLYQPNNEGVDLYIPINHFDLLTFVKHFNEIIPCQNSIQTNHRQTILLFVYSENLDRWLWNHNPIEDNIQEIKIFSPFWEDNQYFQQWTRFYTQKPIDVFTFDQLERELLICGLGYIEEISSNFQGNEQILEQLRQQQETIRLALIDIFDQAGQ